MRKLTDNAARARTVLRREKTPVSATCEAMIVADITRILSAYFGLEGEVRLRVEQGEKMRIIIEAEAATAKPFGTV